MTNLFWMVVHESWNDWGFGVGALIFGLCVVLHVWVLVAGLWDKWDGRNNP